MIYNTILLWNCQKDILIDLIDDTEWPLIRKQERKKERDREREILRLHYCCNEENNKIRESKVKRKERQEGGDDCMNYVRME